MFKIFNNMKKGKLVKDLCVGEWFLFHNALDYGLFVCTESYETTQSYVNCTIFFDDETVEIKKLKSPDELNNYVKVVNVNMYVENKDK